MTTDKLSKSIKVVFQITPKIVLLQLFTLWRISKNWRSNFDLESLTIVYFDDKKNCRHCANHSSNEWKDCWYLLNLSSISRWAWRFSHTNICVISPIETILRNLKISFCPKAINEASFLFHGTFKRPNAFVCCNSIIRKIKIRFRTHYIPKYNIVWVLEIVRNVVSLILIDDWINIIESQEKLIAHVIEKNLNILLTCTCW